ncbi:MAG: BON domain-containing protein [Pirellulales bacterium]
MKTDTCLQRLVMDELEWEPSIREANIGVTCQEGIVTLRGEVPVFSEKHMAETVAKRVHGVTRVVNDIDVSPDQPHEREDETLEAAARRAIEWDAGVPSSGVQVSVEDGWITLSGAVEHHFERAAAERAVRHMRGSRGVTNEIEVTSIDVAERLAETIASAIARSAALNRHGIDIEVDARDVVLSGDVHTVHEREEAERIAWKARGVRNVENCITVTPWGTGNWQEWGY